MSYACYCLVNPQGRTYVGFTVNLDRRLRQHNGELQGGARATQGSSWRRFLSVTGFPTQQAALQFEWAWKHHTRKRRLGLPVERRCEALVSLLNTEQATSKALPFSTYDGPLNVFAETVQVAELLRDKEMRYGILIE